jgi:hypothetical protein
MAKELTELTGKTEKMINLLAKGGNEEVPHYRRF